MNLCTRCGRKLKRPSPSGMGPVCLIAVLGRKERKQAAEVVRDRLTPDLFPMQLVSAFAVEQGL